MPARVVFLGSPTFAVTCLEALCEQPDLIEVVGVVCQPDKPAGRGQRLAAAPVKLAALARGLPVFTPTKIKTPESLAQLTGWRPDLAVVAAYGRILPKSWLEAPRLGCINVHASLLPRHRGASPIARAILEGDSDTGISIMQMDEGLDTGPVFATRAIPIAKTDTTASLSTKLAELGGRALVQVLPDILAGRLTPVPQPSEGATYAPLLTKADGWLDFREAAVALERRVRAMQPWPQARAQKAGKYVQVISAEVDESRQGAPGTVLVADKRGVWVASGAGSLVLTRVKPEGRGVMDAAAWVAGRGAAVGEQFTLDKPEAA